MKSSFVNKNKITIFLDNFPENLSIFSCEDYSNNYILGLINKPIIDYNKTTEDVCCQIKIIKNKVFLSMNDCYWSDGTKILLDDVYNTFLYHLKSRTPISNSLFFIKNLRDFYQGKKNFSEIGIIKKTNKIVIECDFIEGVRMTLSSVYLSPIKIGKNFKVIENLTSGNFKIIKYSKNNLLIKSTFIDKPNIWVNYILIDDENKIYKKFNSMKNSCITNSLFFKYNLFCKKNTNLIKQSISNLNAGFDFKSKLLKKIFVSYFNLKNKEILEKYQNFVVFYDKTDYMNNLCLKYQKIIKNVVNILVPDYYPNLIYVKILFKSLKEQGYNVKIHKFKMDKYLEELKKNKYDIIYKIFKPITNDFYTFCKMFIPMIKDSNDKFDYVRFLNANAKRNIFDFDQIINFINQNSSLFIFGKFKHTYLAKGFLSKNIFVDNNDFYRFKEF